MTAADWAAMLTRTSFIELDARARAAGLLDAGTARELCGPFDRVESPWLEPQGLVPQADDGVVVTKGELGGGPAVVIGVEQAFQGGGIGEVSGMKITEALSLAAEDNRAGVPTAAVLLLETGGVRLQEANLGLTAVAEVCSAVLELRALRPVVGVVAGALGCFGGMSIAAGLCTSLIMTREGRLGLDGPQVIESEAGVEEFDASDHALIWAINGGGQRTATGLADVLVLDDLGAVRTAVIDAVRRGVPEVHRSARLGELRARLAAVDPERPPEPADLARVWGHDRPPAGAREDMAAMTGPPSGGPRGGAGSRGLAWTRALADGDVRAVVPSVVIADVVLGGDTARLVAVVPDPASPYHRARRGEVGLREGLALAETVTGVRTEDAHLPEERRRPVVAVVDVPSQAYGRVEELLGLHHALAAAVDAYATARAAGHPVITLVVGTALSGGLLAHGYQAGRVLALDDPGVTIHAMHKEAAARVTLRTVAELDELARRVPPLSYDVAGWAGLGVCDGLLDVEDAGHPGAGDVRTVKDALTAAVADARRGPRDLSRRRSAPARAASRRACETLAGQWR
ncbi:biotin-independent malonate decarboxylase subunit beta [Sphaerisporangium sp. B11E5]|uniref:biotin-independent malonate decarboxylase subunit beta n=1 Tax=Sphaerisporangium sp. B11E5 TaxID=3153563 RepID=UPI00325F7F3E